MRSLKSSLFAGAIFLLILVASFMITRGQYDVLSREYKEYRKEQEVKNEESERVIAEQNLLIDSLQEEKKQADLKIIEMQLNIDSADTHTEKRREDVKKLTHSEKVDWLVNRYSIINN